MATSRGTETETAPTMDPTAVGLADPTMPRIRRPQGQSRATELTTGSWRRVQRSRECDWDYTYDAGALGSRGGRRERKGGHAVVVPRCQQGPLAREEHRDGLLGDGGARMERPRALVNYGDLDIPRGGRATTAEEEEAAAPQAQTFPGRIPCIYVGHIERTTLPPFDGDISTNQPIVTVQPEQRRARHFARISRHHDR